MHKGPSGCKSSGPWFVPVSSSGPGWWLWVDVGRCPVWVAPWGPDYMEGLASKVPALGCLDTLEIPSYPLRPPGPCSPSDFDLVVFLLAWQLLSAFKEVVNQKKAKTFGPSCPILVCTAPASHPAGPEDLALVTGYGSPPCPLVSCTLIKHFWSFGIEMPFLPFINT